MSESKKSVHERKIDLQSETDKDEKELMLSKDDKVYFYQLKKFQSLKPLTY